MRRVFCDAGLKIKANEGANNAGLEIMEQVSTALLPHSAERSDDDNVETMRDDKEGTSTSTPDWLDRVTREQVSTAAKQMGLSDEDAQRLWAMLVKASSAASPPQPSADAEVPNVWTAFANFWTAVATTRARLRST